MITEDISIDLFFKTLYAKFNARRIDLVIEQMTDDIEWANGMEGGFVHGHDGVRDYWTRQFTLVNPKVTPIEIKEENGQVKVTVHQVVHDLEGKLLVDQVVKHLFTMSGNQIAEFNIES